MSASVPTIAVFIDHLDYLDGGYSTLIRGALARTATRLKVHLEFFLGKELGVEPECQIYRFATRSQVDGVIVVSATLAARAGVGAVEELIHSLEGIPLCSLGVAFPGIPSVVADNRPGLEELLDHVIVHHQRRRLVCLRGHGHNPDAQVRYAVYRTALQRHGLDFDERLVVGDVYEPNSARLAVEGLIAQGLSFDAVVAVNDGSAVGAFEALLRHGYRIPEDIAVTGFDDLAICRFAHPPMSTVRQPISRMAELALELTYRRIQGHDVPEITELPAQCVVRVSCGCRPIWTKHTLVPRANQGQDPAEWFQRNRARLLEKIAAEFGYHDPDTAWFRGLLDALELELAGEHCAFTDYLEHRCLHESDRERTYDELQTALSVLRDEFGGAGTPLDGLWTLSQQTLATANMSDQTRLRTALEAAYAAMLRSGERLAESIDLVSLHQALSEELPRQLDLVSIALLDPDDRQMLLPFFCLVDGQVHTPATTPFPATAIVPPHVSLTEPRKPWVVLPLTSESEFLGILVLEIQSEVNTHEMLRSQFSAAFRKVNLHQRIVKESMEHARAIQERSATAQRMQSLSLLAGGVAHDLNNALGPLVALPDMIADEIRDVSAQAPAHQAIEDLATIKSAAQRAAITIKDLLTLGRQGRMTRQPLDVNVLVSNCLDLDAFLHEKLKRHNVAMRVDLCPHPLAVLGAETQLQRAVLNLVSNAIDASRDGQTVTVRTRAASLGEALDAYEVIPAGEYVTIDVMDRGSGIDDTDLARIFEPFFTRKQPSETNGSGLGLSIVHGVVKEHDGFAHVETCRGKGTTFSLFIPRRQHSFRSEPPQSTIRRGCGKILVVDDDPVQLRTSRRILTHFGYDVVTVNAPEQALQLIQEDARAGQPSMALVIVDVQLEHEVDGIALLDQIHQMVPNQRAMLVSGHAHSNELLASVRSGVRFLPKPYTREELMRAVHSTLEALPPQAIAATVIL